tara:strand:- start:3259 stop:3795 length:537 start_codon:yes stop_codon:yes gene_type:complete
MLESLVTSKTRIKLLLKFFINPDAKAYLRELAKEFGGSTNSIRVELNHLTKSNLLKSQARGRTVLYKANTSHTFFKDIQRVVLKYVGIESLIENMVEKLGKIKFAYLIGDYANGKDSGIIDLVLVGEINKSILLDLTNKTEKVIHRKIRTVVLNEKECIKLNDTLDLNHSLLIWSEKQ